MTHKEAEAKYHDEARNDRVEDIFLDFGQVALVPVDFDDQCDGTDDDQCD